MKEIFQKAVYYNKNGKIITPVKYVLEVSNLGNIKVNGKLITEFKLNNGGYAVYGQYLIHRLVACTFLENPENKPQVDHIDTNRINNNITNLRWVTNSENMLNPLTRETISKSQKGRHAGEKNPMYGYKWSKEQRKHMSKIMTGRHPVMPDRGDLWRKHISEARKGLKLSPESLEKRRQKMLQKKLGLL